MTRYLALLSILAALPAYAQPEALPARSLAMARAGTADATAWSANPAAADEDASILVGTGRLFGLAELSPVRFGIRTGGTLRLRADVSSLGLPGYSRHALSVGASLRAGAARIGIAARAVRSAAGDLAAQRAAGLSVGAILDVGSFVRVGVIVDPALSTHGARNAGLSPAVAAGVTTDLVDRVLLSLDVRREPPWPATLHAAATWLPVESLRIRSGVTAGAVGVGIGLRIGAWYLEFGALRNEPVGWTWAIDLERSL